MVLFFLRKNHGAIFFLYKKSFFLTEWLVPFSSTLPRVLMVSTMEQSPCMETHWAGSGAGMIGLKN
jgi:hypothetical protein